MPAPVIRFVITEDKTGLHPFRLFSILSLAWLTIRLVPRDAAWLRSRLASMLVLLGQNSLPVFCSGIFFGFIARLGLEFDDTAAMQVGVNEFGAVAMVAVAGLAAWYRSKGRSAEPAATGRLARGRAGLIPDSLACAAWPRAFSSAPSLRCRYRRGPAASWPTPAVRPAEFLTANSALAQFGAAIAAGGPIEVLAVGSATTVGAVTASGLHTSGTQGASFPWHMIGALHAALPDVVFHVTVRGGRGLTAEEMLPLLETALKQQHYPLVLWQTGTVEAVRGLQPDRMLDVLHTGAELVRDSGGDLVLVDPQFSRFLRANTDLDPYEGVMEQVDDDARRCPVPSLRPDACLDQ